MLPLYIDNGFRFRFAEDRIIPRFHLEGVRLGAIVIIYRIDPIQGEMDEVLQRAVVGDSGWVELPQPLIVRMGGGFLVIPESIP